MTYHIQIEKSVLKALGNIETRTQAKIRDAINALAFNQRPFGYKKLVDGDGILRIKVKDYRIVYKIFDEVLIVSILRVAKRNERTY